MGTKNEKKEGATKPAAKTKPKTAPKREAAKPAPKAAVRTAAKTAKKPAAKPAPKPVRASGVNRSDVEVRAYYISLERRVAGFEPDPIADWLEAERQMMS
ncbi:MAG: hypothetical protein RL088_129 [Verrucomicrobiota bacterium]|jgi:hypothetical protein